MKVLGMRFCRVSEESAARDLASFLLRLGLKERGMGEGGGAGFQGGVFPIEHNGENSWIEVWPASDGMPEMTMLQIIVDDADAFAEEARRNGLSPKGPDDAHGERIYFLEAPGGLPVSFQSKLSRP